MSLKLIKLSYGEEVLAEVKTVITNQNQYTLEDAVVIQPAPDQEGNMQLQFLPWTMAMFAADNTVTVERSHVVAEATPAEELVARHSQIFGKIHVPEKKLILS